MPGSQDLVQPDPGEGEEGQKFGFQLHHHHAAGGVRNGDARVMAHPGQPGAGRVETHRVNPAPAGRRVGELGHEVGERHLGAPLRGRRLGFNLLDVGGKDAHLEVRGTSG